jgi:hypothetical protein
MPPLLLFVGEDGVLDRFGALIVLGRDVLGLCGMGKKVVVHGVTFRLTGQLRMRARTG